MKAKLTQVIQGRLITSTFDAQDLVSAMQVRGFAQSGANTNKAQRAELQNQPKFAGVLGPMWGGDDGLCYECPEAYRALSAD